MLKLLCDGVGRGVRASTIFVRAGRAILLAVGGMSSAQANGGLSVTEGGQATYVYSIGVAPGIAGMEPKLSLVYSGGPGQGPVGTGWSIQGISQIVRCASADPLDGPRTAVTFTASDRLCLDGKRLIQTGSDGRPLASQVNDALGLTGTGQREFRSEIDGFARIRAYSAVDGNVNAGPGYLRVWTKAGILNEYGTTSDARVVSSAGVPSAWLLKRSTDTKGNYVEYDYEQLSVVKGHIPKGLTAAHSGREWRLKAARYTGTATQAPSHRVDFHYSAGTLANGATTSSSTAYHAGAKTVHSAVVTKIEVLANQQVVRRVELSYQTSPQSGRLLLSAMRECAGAKCLPSTQFTYSPGGGTYTELASFNLKTTLLHTNGSGATPRIVADFNGDGKSDILSTVGTNRLYLADAAELGKFNPSAAYDASPNKIASGGICARPLMMDINGDGLTDFLYLESQDYYQGAEFIGDPCGASDKKRHFALLNKGDGSFDKVFVSGLHPYLRNGNYANNSAFYSAPIHYHFGWAFAVDLDADGFSDLVTRVGASSYPGFHIGDQEQYVVYRGLGDGRFQQVAAQNPALLRIFSLGWPTGVVADFDGDGIGDWIMGGPTYSSYNPDEDPPVFPAGKIVYPRGFDSAGKLRLEVKAVSLRYPPQATQPYSSGPMPRFGLQIVDANGDGKPDLWNYRPNGGATDHALLLNEGGTFREVSSFYSGADLYPGQQNRRAEFVDLNGDGVEDFIKVSSSSVAAYAARMTADGIPRMDAVTTGLESVLKIEEGGTWEFGDFLGLGSPQALLVRTSPTSSSGNRLFVRSRAVPADMLISVKDSNGLVTDIRYGSLASGVRFDAAGDSSLPDLERPASVGSDFGSTETSLNALPLYQIHRPAGGVNTYPIMHLQPASWVVASTLQGNGRAENEVVATTFAYGGLKASHTGRGLLGFGWMMKRQPYANGQILATITRFHQDPAQFQYLGQPLSEVTEFWAGSSGNLQSEREQMAMVRETMQPRAVKELVNVYCDATASPSVYAAKIADKVTEYQWIQAVLLPCEGSGRVRQPFVAQTRDRTFDLNHDEYELSRTIKTNKALARDAAGIFHGDMADIEVSTIGPFAGVRHTSIQRSVHTYDYRPEYLDKWWLGRLKTSQITSSVAEGGVVTVSTGMSLWTGQMGPPLTEPPPLNYTPRPVELPDLLSIITTLLLND